jgi:hypothetical protein
MQEPAAALALTRWREWQQTCQAHRGNQERRFRRRSYERARDRAIASLLMRFHRRARRGGSPRGPVLGSF